MQTSGPDLGIRKCLQDEKQNTEEVRGSLHPWDTKAGWGQARTYKCGEEGQLIFAQSCSIADICLQHIPAVGQRQRSQSLALTGDTRKRRATTTACSGILRAVPCDRLRRRANNLGLGYGVFVSDVNAWMFFIQ